ncbi:carbohydrate ABC transporter permease [Myceligenerans indicum]|uniref:Maltose/maltodextrin transport system permease protein n=1 Tax=Myceligenerans indicum TaxID=2593663 RepID=A0ABS1LP95_9MICO|nr:sugar ABC transporter permease [Myceligenerans indicum]MBL0888044.1 sugar ABC transporter permease [Myceligenerans indicum]
MAVITAPAEQDTTSRSHPATSPSERHVRILAATFMGLAHLTVLRQRLKGALFALVEAIFLASIPTIAGNVAGLITLGTPQPDLPTKDRDHSTFLMIDGVVTLAVVAVFAAVYYISVRSALTEHRLGGAERPRTIRDQLSALTTRAFPILGLSPMLVLILFFVVVPLVFSTLVAFTNYSSPEHVPPANTVDWVGLDNFATMFGGSALWTGALTRVFVWTTVWAVLAVSTTFCGGMLLAIVLHESNIRIKPVFRAIFILPYAVPAVVTMLIWRNMLNGAFGAVNKTLIGLGIVDQPIPWLSDPWLAKFVVVAIGLWAGFPYFMLLTMGAMTAIPRDLLEAAALDGATKSQRFRHVILPLVLYQTAPLIIMSLAMNFNNFGAIFFLTAGGPTVADTTATGAGATDILITWIYNLTVGLMHYNYGSVIAVMIFLVLAPFAIFNFRRTKAFKGEL